MTVDPTVVPGLLLLAAELLALAAVGFVVARVALRQSDDRMALAQGLAVGPALWGLTVNFLLHVLPGLAGAIAGWVIFLAIGAGLVWRRPAARRLSPRAVAADGRRLQPCGPGAVLDRTGLTPVAFAHRP